MQRVSYANADFLTDDGVANALMAYASVLAIVNTADVVEVPGVDELGAVRTYRLIIGPASQILAVGTDAESVPMDVDRAVGELTRRSAVKLPTTEDVIAAEEPFGTDSPAER